MFISKEAILTKVIYTTYCISCLFYTQNIEEYIEPVQGVGMNLKRTVKRKWGTDMTELTPSGGKTKN